MIIRIRENHGSGADWIKLAKLDNSMGIQRRLRAFFNRFYSVYPQQGGTPFKGKRLLPGFVSQPGTGTAVPIMHLSKSITTDAKPQGTIHSINSLCSKFILVSQHID